MIHLDQFLHIMSTELTSLNVSVSPLFIRISLYETLFLVKSNYKIYLKVFLCFFFFFFFNHAFSSFTACDTKDICKKKYLTAQSGYISTPRYPNNLHGPFSCSMKIEVLSHQQIHLHIIDLDLKSNTGSNCTDYLYIDQMLNSITLCGRRSNEKIYTFQNIMNLSLVAGSKGSHKGLWLYYEGNILYNHRSH